MQIFGVSHRHKLKPLPPSSPPPVLAGMEPVPGAIVLRVASPWPAGTTVYNALYPDVPVTASIAPGQAQPTLTVSGRGLS
jgi:hypothetical protein